MTFTGRLIVTLCRLGVTGSGSRHYVLKEEAKDIRRKLFVTIGDDNEQIYRPAIKLSK